MNELESTSKPSAEAGTSKSETRQQQGQDRYIDLSSDVGFKIAFGNPDAPELITGLLNALLPEREITEIEFLNGQITPEDLKDKRVCFDIRCTEKNGRSFVVEMQKEKYEYMVDRLVVYAGDPLKRLLKAGQGYDEIKPLYVICIADFIFKFTGDTEEGRRQLVRSAKLRLDDTKKTLSDKLNFIFLQLPAVKELSEGQGFLEQWAYAVRNINEMQTKPEVLKGQYFERLFRAAERTYINKTQLEIYDYMIRDEVQIKAERDYAIREAVEEAVKNALDCGREEGISVGEAKGREEERAVAESEKIEAARELLKNDVPVQVVAASLHLSQVQVEKLLRDAC